MATYFERLLEVYGGDANKAARRMYEGCPSDHFEGARKLCYTVEGCTCGQCWTRESIEASPGLGEEPKGKDAGWNPGDLFIYQNGDSFEIGKVKRVASDGVFAYYSEGDTAAKTPFDSMRRLVNTYTVKRTSLGWKEENEAH